MKLAEQVKIPVKCPKCGHEFEQTIAWLVARDKIDCASCGSAFAIKDEETRHKIRVIQKTCEALDGSPLYKLK